MDDQELDPEGRDQSRRPAADQPYVHRILTNVSYLGKVQHHDQLFEGRARGDHRTDAVEAGGDDPGGQRARQGERRPQHHHGLLKGLVRCRNCDKPMSHTFTTKAGKRTYRYYACHAAQSQGYHTCPSKSIPAEAARVVRGRAAAGARPRPGTGGRDSRTSPGHSRVSSRQLEDHRARFSGSFAGWPATSAARGLQRHRPTRGGGGALAADRRADPRDRRGTRRRREERAPA